MRGITTVLATIFPLLIFSVADAQCRRGGGGGTSMGSSMASASPMSRGNFMPTSASTAMMSGMNMFNPLSSSTNAAARAARVRVQLAQQQALAQQRYFQTVGSTTGPARLASTVCLECWSGPTTGPAAARRARMRQEKAGRLLELAERAEVDGRRSTARKNYGRVVRLVGDTGNLGQRAVEALATLTDPKRAANYGEMYQVSTSRSAAAATASRTLSRAR